MKSSNQATKTKKHLEIEELLNDGHQFIYNVYIERLTLKNIEIKQFILVKSSLLIY